MTAHQSATHLDEHLYDLHERLHTGRYQAMPMERIWIEQEDRPLRSLGQLTCEDKIAQRAVARLLEAICGQDLSDGSYGFGQAVAPTRHYMSYASQQPPAQAGGLSLTSGETC